jgi:hypothetical protein
VMFFIDNRKAPNFDLYARRVFQDRGDPPRQALPVHMAENEIYTGNVKKTGCDQWLPCLVMSDLTAA